MDSARVRRNRQFDPYRTRRKSDLDEDREGLARQFLESRCVAWRCTGFWVALANALADRQTGGGGTIAAQLRRRSPPHVSFHPFLSVTDTVGAVRRRPKVSDPCDIPNKLSLRRTRGSSSSVDAPTSKYPLGGAHRFMSLEAIVSPHRFESAGPLVAATLSAEEDTGAAGSLETRVARARETLLSPKASTSTAWSMDSFRLISQIGNGAYGLAYKAVMLQGAAGLFTRRIPVACAASDASIWNTWHAHRPGGRAQGGRGVREGCAGIQVPRQAGVRGGSGAQPGETVGDTSRTWPPIVARL
jgi:hypothetical protein